jgi:hypothetical protein
MKVRWYGRWLFMVASESDPEMAGLEYLVDLEPELDNEGKVIPGGEPWQCGCKAHFYNITRPCKHVKAVVRFIKPLFAYLAAFKPAKTTTSHDTKCTTNQPRQYKLNPNKTRK